MVLCNQLRLIHAQIEKRDMLGTKPTRDHRQRNADILTAHHSVGLYAEFKRLQKTLSEESRNLHPPGKLQMKVLC